MEIYNVDNVEEAIELANNFREEGKYDYFRGQVHPWPVQSSLLRFQLKYPSNWREQVMPRYSRYKEWLDTIGLHDVSNNVHASFAVAQHYGMPTHYIDFSTDASVAGFFASDGACSQIDPPGCIYCLNSKILSTVWKSIKNLNPAFDFDVEIINVHVPNLWRLQAQQGVFVYCPFNWEELYPMDRILFNKIGYPAYPTKHDIYPDRKSQLEILLDQFFENERNRIATKKLFEDILEMRNKGIVMEHLEFDAPPKYAAETVSCDFEEHETWSNSKIWAYIPDEHYDNINRREVIINVDFRLSANDICNKFSIGVRRSLSREKDLRNHLVKWNILSQHIMTDSLTKGLDSIWDGLRLLPCSDEDISIALGTWVGLHQLGITNTITVNEDDEIMDALLGQSIRVEFGSVDGSYSRGYVNSNALLNAVRDDIESLIHPNYLDRLSEVEFLLMSITSPRYLFDFNKLASVFVRQIVPTQMLRTPPHFFHPARLNTFGLP